MGWDRAIVYDVEVEYGPDEVEGGWDNPEGMGFASAVAFDYGMDQYRFFLGPKGKLELLKLLHGKTAITFNGVKFDSRVMLGNSRNVQHQADYPLPIVQNSGHWWFDCDLLLLYIQARFRIDDVGEAEKKLGDKAIHDGSFGLDGLAEGTFGLHKSGHGANAPILYRQHKYSELLEYNLHDVRLTKKVFEFLCQHEFIVDRVGRVVRIPAPTRIAP